MARSDSPQPQVQALYVRRWGDDQPTPIVLDDRKTCGTHSDHMRRGCIALSLDRPQALVHLTTDDALRLADLLRAMADTNAAAEGQP